MHGIRKCFGATVALDGVDLAVRGGEIRALVGENGAGKSTLMKVLSGAVSPDAGSMHLAGNPYRPRNAMDARRAGVAMIYQELSLADHLSVEQNILLGMEPVRFGFVRRGAAVTAARAALAQLGHPEISPTARTATLSLAERQIVEIARAVAVGCRVLILDEPTSSLTRQDIDRLFALLRNLRDQGHSIVYISHFLEEVAEIAGTYTVLRDGRTVSQGLIAEVSCDELVQQMIGRKVEQLYPHSLRQEGEVLLEIRGLTGRSKPRCATLELRRGEILGIAGLVGSGRTELLRAVFGLDPIRSGRVRLGAFLGPASPSRRWAQGAGFLCEDRTREGLALGLSITQNILMNLRKDAHRFGFFRPAVHRRRAREWISRLSIHAAGPDQPAGSLSGGNQQKIALARLLHEDVDVLLLDEPTRGIDVPSKSQIYEILDALAVGDPQAGRPPKAILLVSSYLPELLGICDRIAVMARGRLGLVQPANQWNVQSLVLAAFGQGAAP